MIGYDMTPSRQIFVIHFYGKEKTESVFIMLKKALKMPPFVLP